MGYVFLGVAIVFEVAATLSLRLSEGFTKLVPSLIVVAGYAVSFYCLSHVVKTVPVAVSYSLWSGIGIVLIAIFSYFYYGQVLDWPAIIGIALITAGVLLMNLFSKSMVLH